MSIKRFRVACLIGAIVYVQAVYADTINLAGEDRSALGLTIYNHNLVMVNDSYNVQLPVGDSTFSFNNISPLITPASAVLHPLPEDVRVTGQYFQAPFTSEDLLLGSVGKTVSLVRVHPHSGEQTIERARILAAGTGLIFEIDGRYETELAGRRVIYDQLPAGVLMPTLSIGVRSEAQQQTELTLSYLSGGLSWQADYTARLNAAEDSVQLLGMATLSNHSGLDFKNARIELVAGSVNQVSTGTPRRVGAVLQMAAMENEAPASRKSLGDLYLYALPGLHDLADGSTRQLSLFSARNIPVKKHYRLSGNTGLYFSPLPGDQELKADSYIEFDNDVEHKLGQPMPAGMVRVYMRTEAGADSLKFIGEDRIEHTPEMARVRLKTGRAFDISAIRKQLAYQRLPVEQPYRQHSEVELLTVIQNARKEAVTVQLKEVFAGEWKLVAGPPPDEQDALGASWNVEVPANGETEMRLTIRVKR